VLTRLSAMQQVGHASCPARGMQTGRGTFGGAECADRHARMPGGPQPIAKTWRLHLAPGWRRVCHWHEPDPMMHHLSRQTGDYWRGGYATLRVLAGAPSVFAQAAWRSKDPEDARRLISRHIGRFLETCRISVSVEGEVPELGTGCVVCHNETSFADVAAYFIAIWPHVDRLAGADLYGYFPFAKAACRRLDIELVARGNRKATDPLLARMASAVQQGARVGWGGEGRLSGKDGIGQFKVGGSLIAIRAQAPVVPVIIHGGHDAMPLGTFRARSGEIRIRFCEPVPTTGYAETDARAFADTLQAEFVRNYKELSEQRRVLS
jgi:1-acyl-sn-glycerol-3-phosphate acyltransferase